MSYVLLGTKRNQYSVQGETRDFALVFNTELEAKLYRKKHPMYRFDYPIIKVGQQWLINQIPRAVCEYLDEEALPRYADGHRSANEIAEAIQGEIKAWEERQTSNFVDGLSEQLTPQEPITDEAQLVYGWISELPLHLAMVSAYVQNAFTLWQTK